ncbi:type II toxin-antitoxin system VapC family toxin [uncultured Sphingomonas sp.]|uniref:type II toxin-antitoxin system VapC family toxin n=1 Tax=uncultured Sphingomonas sp. TaxID=158754 RepID=UPI0035C9ADF2
MRILLDTHFLIWLATDDQVLSRAEQRLLKAADTTILLSTISIWELRVKEAAQARRGKTEPALLAGDAITFARLNELPILAPHVDDYAAPLVPPITHTDPFDEMLLVHAQQLGAKLLTRDDRLSGHALAASPV